MSLQVLAQLHHQISGLTGYTLVRSFPLSAETIRHIWLPPRLYCFSCFLSRLMFPAESVRVILLLAETTEHNKWLHAESVRVILLPAETAEHNKWVSAESVRVILLPAETTEINEWLPAESVRVILLPVETAVHNKWLPAESVRVILLPAEILGRKYNRADSLGRSHFSRLVVSAGSENWLTSLYPLNVASTSSFNPRAQFTISADKVVSLQVHINSGMQIFIH